MFRTDFTYQNASAARIINVMQHFRYLSATKNEGNCKVLLPGMEDVGSSGNMVGMEEYGHLLMLASLSFISPRRPLSRSSPLVEDKLTLYAALLTSPKQQ